jgi:2-amino-4-hydroxy-6-hydroxymethyldihydropteridine diphosphokinase
VAQCWIGLGGNQGDVPGAIAEVVRRLHVTFGTPVAVSPLFRTAAMGVAAGSDYWNAVAGCDVALPPADLLRQLQQWELELGRVREVHWGPRTIDLDLLFYGDAVVCSPGLTVPHPGAWYRRFVLEPLRTVAPQLVHPVWGQTIHQLLARLTTGEPAVWLYHSEPALTAELSSRLPHLSLGDWNGRDAVATGLLIALRSPPLRTIPHLRLPDQLPTGELVQAIVDAWTAAFDVPRPIAATRVDC